MDRDLVMAKVRERVKGLPGVIDFQYLDKGWRDQLMLLEKEAETNGACGGLMPFTNRGVWSAFEREVQFLIVASCDTVLLGVSQGLVHIEDQNGQEKLKLETPGGCSITLKDGPGTIEAQDSNGNSVKLEPAGITVNASARVVINASQVEVSAGMVTVSAGMSKFSGVVQADTVITNTIIAATYTPGAGNIL